MIVELDRIEAQLPITPILQFVGNSLMIIIIIIIISSCEGRNVAFISLTA